MIRTESEYREALDRLKKDKEVIAQQVAALEEMQLTPEQIDRAIQPSICFHDQLKEEVEAYEKIRRGDFEPLNSLTQIGRFLIGLRISLDLSQKDLADKLGIAQSAVSRDERNEYHGITVERAQRILEAMGVRISLCLEEPLRKAA